MSWVQGTAAPGLQTFAYVHSFRETFKCNLNMCNYVFISITYWFLQLVGNQLKLVWFFFFFFLNHEKSVFNSKLHHFIFVSISTLSVFVVSGASMFVLSQAKMSLFDKHFSSAHVLVGRCWQRIPNPTMSLLCHSFWNVDILRLTQTLNCKFFKSLENNVGYTPLFFAFFTHHFFFSPQ